MGEFPFHEWHKREKENILKAVGVRVEYGEPLYEGEYRGTFRTVSDKEHAEMIRLYIEEGLSFDKIAEHLSRSSRTLLLQVQKHNRAIRRSDSVQLVGAAEANIKAKSHIRKHNGAVERSGLCLTCGQAKRKYESGKLRVNA